MIHVTLSISLSYLLITQVRNDEVFRRIFLADLLQLMVAHAEDTEAAASYQCEADANADTNGSDVPIKYRDDVELVVHKMTELEVIKMFMDEISLAANFLGF